jgi:hypothetical protein
MAPGGGIFGFVALDAGDYAQGSSHGEDKYRTFSDGYERLRAALRLTRSFASRRLNSRSVSFNVANPCREDKSHPKSDATN